MHRVFTTEEFDRDFSKLDGSDKRKVSKIMDELKKKGKDVGKPLGRNYFREKKFGSKRLYFLAYEKKLIVLAVGISNKKMQQTTIDKILLELKNYEDYIKKL
jgi:mRNA-degrading endonuclease RelE of RelBE toxin-antitoxin system